MKKLTMVIAGLLLFSTACAKTVRPTMTGYIEVTESDEVYLIVIGGDAKTGEVILLENKVASEVIDYVGYLLEFEYTPTDDGKTDISFISIVEG